MQTFSNSLNLHRIPGRSAFNSWFPHKSQNYNQALLSTKLLGCCMWLRLLGENASCYHYWNERNLHFSHNKYQVCFSALLVATARLVLLFSMEIWSFAQCVCLLQKKACGNWSLCKGPFLLLQTTLGVPVQKTNLDLYDVGKKHIQGHFFTSSTDSENHNFSNQLLLNILSCTSILRNQ